MTKVLTTGFAGDRKVFDDYYDKYALARWTIDKPHELANFRKELSTDLKTAAVRDANVHRELGSKILAYMGKLVQGNFHPAVRVNAMLMIGELNATEDKKSPAPLPAALTDSLLPAVSDARQLDAVKVAALIGIVRHAKLGIVAAADRDAVREKMRALAAAKTPPDSAADGRAWMRALAAETLGAIGQTGNAGDVVKALAVMVDDSGLSLATRCIAAEALSKLDYSDPRGLDASIVAGPLGHLAVDVCAAEAKEISRRRLKARLNAVSLAVSGDPADAKRTGVAVLPAGANPQLMAGLKKSVQAMTALVDDEKLDDLGLSDGIKREAAALEALVPKTAP